MELSKKAMSIKPSTTMAISSRAAEMMAAGVDVVSFGAGEPDFDTPAHIAQAGIDAIQNGQTRYTPAAGTPELRQAVCDKLKRDNGLEYEPAQVVISNGAKHSLMNTFMAILHEGDEVIIPAPFWLSYAEMVRIAGGVPVIIHTKKENGFMMTKEELENAFRETTRCVFAESISNPSMVVLDFEKFAKVAHAHGVPLIVDNTFPTPINCKPFQFGVDIVTHSTTKYMDGHAMTVGGAIVDSGNFDWTKYPDKFPGLCYPDESYHGVNYTERFGKKAYITKATAQLMRDLGSIPSPMNAFLLNIGLETLHLRVPRHCENAQKVAEFLEAHDKVKWVNYPGLKSNKYYDLAQKYMPNGTCGVISFAVDGTKEDTVRFMDALRLAAIVTHVADARTCVLHPASHTHRQMNEQQLKEAGVDPGMIRLSVGIEDVADIIADLEQALKTL